MALTTSACRYIRYLQATADEELQRLRDAEQLERQASHGLQLQSLWTVPAAAVS